MEPGDEATQNVLAAYCTMCSVIYIICHSLYIFLRKLHLNILLSKTFTVISIILLADTHSTNVQPEKPGKIKKPMKTSVHSVPPSTAFTGSKRKRRRQISTSSSGSGQC